MEIWKQRSFLDSIVQVKIYSELRKRSARGTFTPKAKIAAPDAAPRPVSGGQAAQTRFHGSKLRVSDELRTGVGEARAQVLSSDSAVLFRLA